MKSLHTQDTNFNLIYSYLRDAAEREHLPSTARLVLCAFIYLGVRFVSGCVFLKICGILNEFQVKRQNEKSAYALSQSLLAWKKELTFLSNAQCKGVSSKRWDKEEIGFSPPPCHKDGICTVKPFCFKKESGNFCDSLHIQTCHSYPFLSPWFHSNSFKGKILEQQHL